MEINHLKYVLKKLSTNFYPYLYAKYLNKNQAFESNYLPYKYKTTYTHTTIYLFKSFSQIKTQPSSLD